MAPSAKKNLDRNPPYRPAEKKSDLGKMAKKKPRISIPNSFFIWRISIFFFWRISIPNSFLTWRISIPNQFQKDLGETAVKTVGFSWGYTKGGAQGAHSTKGHTREHTGAHSGHTVGAEGTFLLFKLER